MWSKMSVSFPPQRLIEQITKMYESLLLGHIFSAERMNLMSLLEMTNIVIKNLILVFHINSVQIWLLKHSCQDI